jgi:hypothetical protein
MDRGVVLLGFRSGTFGETQGVAQRFDAARLLSKDPRHDADRSNSRMYDPVARRQRLSFKIDLLP